MCEVSPKKTHQPTSHSPTKKNSKNKKGWQKGEKAWQVETPKRWPASGGLTTQPFLKRKYTQSIFWLNVANWLKLISFKMAK